MSAAGPGGRRPPLQRRRGGRPGPGTAPPTAPPGGALTARAAGTEWPAGGARCHTVRSHAARPPQPDGLLVRLSCLLDDGCRVGRGPGRRASRGQPAVHLLVRTDEIINCSVGLLLVVVPAVERRAVQVEDRKSTRLNSSHVKISYAVFCLKKK